MTRKEPQFSDDLNTPIAVAETIDSARSDIGADHSRRMTSAPPKQSSSNWLLWLFVVVSLCLSFGMAFFGLEEAGRYQAALTKAENQAKALEETIERLNRLQTQGIGELAQSDAQMRQMMSSVQTKLAEDIEKKFSNVSRRFEVLSADLGRTSQANEDMTKDVAGLSTSIDSLQEGIGLLQGQVLSERSRLDKATQTIDSIGSQIQLVTNETVQLNERLQSGERKLDETAKLAEQALDDKTAIIAVEVLAEEVVGYKQLLEDLRNDLLKQQDSNLAFVNQLENLRAQVAGVKELEPQISKLSKLISDLDVGRKQITQRIIDLDARWNEFSRLERIVIDSQKRIQNIDSQLNENAESLGKLQSKIDDYANQAVIAR
jgi:chromosome segregation ATPase